MTVPAGSFQYRVVEGWGRGPQGRDPGAMVTGVGVDTSDRVYAFARRHGGAVFVYDQRGHFLDAWGVGLFAEPHGVGVGADRVCCADREDHTVRVFTSAGRLLYTLGSPDRPGEPGLPFNKPAKAVFSSGGDLFVADGYGQARIHRFDPDGHLRFSWGTAGRGPGQFSLPHSLVVDERGRLIVVDRENHRLQLFDQQGTWLAAWGGLRQPMDIALGPDGNLYVAEAFQRVSIWGPAGDLLSHWGDQGTAPGQFASFLHGICVDSHGDVYVADEVRMQKFERI